MSSMLCWRFMRRARARRSAMSRPLASSMKIGALFSSPAARNSAAVASDFSLRVIRFRAMRHALTWARPHSIRFARDVVSISSEKIITGCGLLFSPSNGFPLMSLPSATHSAMFIANEVLPTEGRAAMTIISAFLRPRSFSSMYLKPVGRPSIIPVDSKRRSMERNVLSIAVFQSRRTEA